MSVLTRVEKTISVMKNIFVESYKSSTVAIMTSCGVPTRETIHLNF